MSTPRLHCGLATILVLGLWLALAPAAKAADATFVGSLALAIEDEVATKLGLTAEKKAELLKVVEQREAAALELALSIKNLPMAEQEAKLAPFREESEQLGLKLLTEAQVKLLETIRIQRAGMAAIGEASVAEKLKLSEKQQADLKELLKERQSALDKSAGAAHRAALADYERKIFGVLDATQKAAWDEISGPSAGGSLVVKAEDPKSADSKPEAEPGKTDPPATDPPKSDSPRRDPRDPRRGPGGRNDGPSGDSSKTEPSKTEPVKTELEPRRNGPADKVRFSFRSRPWKEVVEWLSKEADLSLIADTFPAGTFNYQDSKSYTPTEAIDVLNGIMLTRGFCLVKRERMLIMVNLADGIPDTLVRFVPLDELDSCGQFEIVKTMFEPKRMTPEEAAAEIRPLLGLGTHGSANVLSKSGQLVVTDTGGRLRIIRSVIKASEDPGSGLGEKLKVFTFKYITPLEATGTIKQLIKADSVQMVIDSGVLLVSGRAEAIRRVEEIIATIDVASRGDGSGGPKLKVYNLGGLDPTSVRAVLDTILAGLPDVRLTTDPKTGNLIALARPAQHITIEETITQMQRDVRKVEVIKLRRVDPQLAVLTINKLFGGEGDAAATAPKVEADVGNKQLLIRGNDTQISQIRGMLKQMGEDESVNVASDPTARPSLRTHSIGSAKAAAELADRFKDLWPTVRENKINSVVPSKIGSALRSVNEIRKPAADPDSDPSRLPDESGETRLPNLKGQAPKIDVGPDGSIRREVSREEALEVINQLKIEALKKAGEKLGRPLPPETERPAPKPAPKKLPDDTTEAPARVRVPARFAKLAGQDDDDDDEPAITVNPVPVPVPVRVPVESAPSDKGPADKTPTTPTDKAPVPAVPAEKSPADKPPVTPRLPAPQVPAPGSETKTDVKPSGPTRPLDQEESVPGAPITMTVMPDGRILFASKDLDALDEIDELMSIIKPTAPATSGRHFTIYYLKYARAASVSELLGTIFGGGAAASGGGGGRGGRGGRGGGGLMGDLAGAAFGEMGGGLMGSLLGIGGGEEDVPQSLAGGQVIVIPDSRLNALIVQGSEADLDTLQELLQVLDQQTSPEDVLVQARPRLISLKYTNAEQLATVIRSVYADRIAGAQQQNRQPNPQEFLQALSGRGGGGRGGRGGGGRGGRGGGAQEDIEFQKLTISADTRTNSLIVSAPDSVYTEVKELVAQLDKPSTDSNQTHTLVTLKKSNPQAVQQALAAIVGEQVRTNNAQRQAQTSSLVGGAPMQNQRRVQTGGNNFDQIRAMQSAVQPSFQGFQGGGGGGFQGGGGGNRGGGGGFQGGGGGGNRGGGGGFQGGGGGGNRGGGGGFQGGGGGGRGGRGGGGR